MLGRGLIGVSGGVLVWGIVRIFLGHYSTPLGLLMALAVVGVVEGVAVVRNNSSTISETRWRLTLTRRERICLYGGVAAGVLIGHLEWQSSRTNDVLRCESMGGHTQCVLPVGKVAGDEVGVVSGGR